MNKSIDCYYLCTDFSSQHRCLRLTAHHLLPKNLAGSSLGFSSFRSAKRAACVPGFTSFPSPTYFGQTLSDWGSIFLCSRRRFAADESVSWLCCCTTRDRFSRSLQLGFPAQTEAALRRGRGGQEGKERQSEGWRERGMGGEEVRRRSRASELPHPRWGRAFCTAIRLLISTVSTVLHQD